MVDVVLGDVIVPTQAITVTTGTPSLGDGVQPRRRAPNRPIRGLAAQVTAHRIWKPPPATTYDDEVGNSGTRALWRYGAALRRVMIPPRRPIPASLMLTAGRRARRG
jgi:hypothetical protein